MSRIKVLLVDDQALFREGLHTLLETQDDFEVVGEAGNGKEAVEIARRIGPDIVLMDLRMPVLDGVAATRQIMSGGLGCRVIMLTTFNDDEYIFDGLRAGASGYLLKDASSDELMMAIRTVAKGDSFLQPAITSKVVAELNRLVGQPFSVAPGLVEPLSEREVEILRLLASGASNKEIAAALYIVEGTVKNHITNILGKLGVTDRTQAALKAKELRLL